MNFISANIDLQDYVGKHTILDIDGSPRKFLITPADESIVYPSSSILLTNEYDILGLATIQFCPPCSATFVISKNIESVPVVIGDPHLMYIDTLGAIDNLHFQWFKNDIPILSANAPFYPISAFFPADATNYKVSVTGQCNEATSEGKLFIATLNTFASACTSVDQYVFTYNNSDYRYRYDTLAGNLVNGMYYKNYIAYEFMDGLMNYANYSCKGVPGNPWFMGDGGTTTTTTPAPCICVSNTFDNTCYNPTGTLTNYYCYCDELYHVNNDVGSALSNGTAYSSGYKYVFVNGVLTSTTLCATTTTPHCKPFIFKRKCIDGSPITLYYCIYWYYEPNGTSLVDEEYVLDDIIYTFSNGVAVATRLCPVTTTTPPPTTPPPDCCQMNGYESSPLSDWGPNYGEVTVYCPNPIDDYINCYQYIPPTTTPRPTTTIRPTTTPRPTTTTPRPGCGGGSITAPTNDTTYNLSYNGLGDIGLLYNPSYNPLFPIPIVDSGGPPYGAYDTICVAGGTTIVITAGCVSEGASCAPTTTPRPTTTSRPTTTTHRPTTTTAKPTTTSRPVTTTPTPCPPNGTLLGTYCTGFDLWGTYADGICGTYGALIETNSGSCGYSPPSPTTTPSP